MVEWSQGVFVGVSRGHGGHLWYAPLSGYE